MTGRSIARRTRSGTFVGPGIWRNGRPLVTGSSFRSVWTWATALAIGDGPIERVLRRAEVGADWLEDDLLDVGRMLERA
jgi:hypothetical protein